MVRASDLSAVSWVDAAYEQFCRAGIGSVRVEALARALGATKGSFYWHFANRKALVDAVMDRWEATETEQVIAAANAGGTAAERLELLFAAVAGRATPRHGEVTLYVEAAAEGVRDHVARVTERRLTYLAQILVELGFDRGEAFRRAMIATSVVLGLQQVAAGTGQDVLGVAGAGLTATALRMTLAR